MLEKIRTHLIFLAISVLSLFLYDSYNLHDANAEIFRWIDDKGSVHYTDNPSNIPLNKRNSIIKKRNQSSSALKNNLSCVVNSKINTKKNLDDLFSKLEGYFRIRFIYKKIPTFTWKLGYKSASSQDLPLLLSYAVIVCEEFKKYPLSFISKIKLGSVVIVKNLSINGQIRQALPDYFKESLVLNFDVPRYDKVYIRHLIHHELYHMIEQEFNRDAYWKDPNWDRLNSKQFRYGSGGINARSSNMFPLSHPQKGFVNLYSMSGLEEDKAEIYACLFIASERKKIMEWAKTDPFLLSKIRYMKSFLKGIDNLIS